MDTNALIAELANSATPVRRLPTPWVRMLMWLVISVPFLAVIWLVMPSDINTQLSSPAGVLARMSCQP